MLYNALISSRIEQYDVIFSFTVGISRLKRTQNERKPDVRESKTSKLTKISLDNPEIKQIYNNRASPGICHFIKPLQLQ